GQSVCFLAARCSLIFVTVLSICLFNRSATMSPTVVVRKYPPTPTLMRLISFWSRGVVALMTLPTIVPTPVATTRLTAPLKMLRGSIGLPFIEVTDCHYNPCLQCEEGRLCFCENTVRS